jgi:hypothetical protein
MAVNLFQAGGGGNWGNTASWSLGTVPTASDGHVTTFDATSPDCTLGGGRTCNAIDFTGYTNTLTMGTSTLTVAGDVTWDSGLLITGSGALIVNTTSTITTLNGYVWPNEVNFTTSTSTKTFVNDFEILGPLIIGNGSHTLDKTTNEKIILHGGLIQSIGNILVASTIEKIVIKGGTWSGSAGTSYMRVPVELDGNVTIGANIYLNNGATLTHISGSIDTTTNNSTVNIISNVVIDTGPVIWQNFSQVLNNPTVTLNSTLRVINYVLSIGGFDGTSGFDVDNFSSNAVSAITISMSHSVSYRIRSSLSAFTSRVGSIVLFTSNHASNKAILTLDNPAACNVLASFRRIDASGGRTIPTFNGTITDCLNIVEFHDLPTSSHAL